MPNYVAYYRVSTDKQGHSGLGLDAQRDAVARYLGDRPMLAEFTEIESGKRHTNRPQLAAALDMCRRRRAVLVIAKLDRLARNVHFLSGLMESGVEFVAVDMPEANRLVVHILAAVAEHEREMISQRTKAALAEVRRRGTRMGNPRWQATLHLARAARHPVQPPRQVIDLIHRRRAQGESLRAIASHLDGLGIRTVNGRQWHPQTIRELLSRSQQEQTR